MSKQFQLINQLIFIFLFAGIANAGCICTGGTVTNIGGYCVHTFTDLGESTFQIPYGLPNITIDFLIVAGGGGGGGGKTNGYYCGGGGGGGVLYQSNITLTYGNITIDVGAGGAGGNSATVRGSNGENSSFGNYTAIGGGGGGTYNTTGNGMAGASGGSGGGADGGGSAGAYLPMSLSSQTDYLGVTRFGNKGGGVQNSYQAGAGGGGAGQNASNVTTQATGTNGGNGIDFAISGTNTYYGGGGGGGGTCSVGGFYGIGGLGGGGNGTCNDTGLSTIAGNGTPNTGGGGGGIGRSSNIGGYGGSGIVIIRYINTTATTTTTTTSTSTTLYIPPNKPSNTGVLYIYAIIFPILAVYFLKISIKKNNYPRAMPSLMAGILWFISAQTTANIRFIDVVSDATYLDLGNPEFSIVFSLFGLIMVLFSVYLLFKPAEQAIREVQK